MKNIAQILPVLNPVAVKGKADSEFVLITQDSRKVKPNSLFFAVEGITSDGHDFIDACISNGATIIIHTKPLENILESICYIRVPDISIAIAEVAKWFYDDPSGKLKLVGITGTNGKTTLATLLHQMMNKIGRKSGLISTIDNYTGTELSKIQSKNTTPDSLSINKLLTEMVNQDCEFCFMEVSSHGIELNRIYGLSYDIAVFTNITHDHLDFHGTFANYIQAKKHFFDRLDKKATAIVNFDDKNGAVMLQNTNAKKVSFAIKNTADYKLKVLEQHLEGSLLKIGAQSVWTQLVGEFNASNLLAIYAVASELGIDSVNALEVISLLRSAKGRFETVIVNNITAIIDYAHTPDALLNVLKTIDKLKKKAKLLTVVGAGGNRDATKRPKMAKTAAKYSDKLILTSDNPRFEDPLLIISDMEKGINQQERRKTLSITDRKEAIKTACMFAQKGDIILIAGKGHENYQEIKGQRFHFDDKEIVVEILTMLGN